MKKNVFKSMFHFDRFNMEQYQKVVNAKNGIEELPVVKTKFDYQMFFLKVAVLFFLIVLITLSISTICFINE